MSAETAPPSSSRRTVSLRELNQGSGRIIRDVEETCRPVTVTDHGKPIAQIVPIKPDETPYERLVREGRVRPARRAFRIPVRRIAVPEGVDVHDLILGEREEER